MEQRGIAKINWLDWTEAAFTRAKTENKPILLDISAVWCHWCHRLDQDTYAVPDIVEYIESHFIPIRVDTDKRPDINRRYNLGGWPTTAFLTSDGRVIGGGTYFPPEKMRQLLRDVRSYWEKSKRQTLENPAAEQEPKISGSLTAAIIDEVLGEIANNFDPIYGGFGSQPKFPNTEAHELALLKFHSSGNREFLRVVTVTLQNAGKGGVYDKEAGGFFRYSTLRDWSIPHFEKMCEDNAKWLSLYLHAYQATQDGFYIEKAKGIIDYVNTWLSDSYNGCFYGSQDADEEYYKLTKSQRADHQAPYVDKNIYTNWNALMISAYLESAFILADDSLMEFGLKSLDRLVALNYKPGQGVYHYYDDQPRVPNQLTDQIQAARTLCQAHGITGKIEFLKLAEDLVESTIRNLYDRDHGGFFDTRVDPSAPGFLSKPSKPLDENSLAACLLITLYHLTNQESYRKLAEDTLRNFMELYSQFGVMAADYAIATDALISDPTIIRIVGPMADPTTRALLTEAMNVFEPRKIVQVLDPADSRQMVTSLGLQTTSQPAAYVCFGKTCMAPTAEPAQLRLQISQTNVPESTK